MKKALHEQNEKFNRRRNNKNNQTEILELKNSINEMKKKNQ